ncbi:MAG: hypothetical protein VX346_11855 [Planctomycetota bacterium]|nr:hypothetical protein [Planctomycetota bacterium]
MEKRVLWHVFGSPALARDPRGIASCPKLLLDEHDQLLASWQLEQGSENTA